MPLNEAAQNFTFFVGMIIYNENAEYLVPDGSAQQSQFATLYQTNYAILAQGLGIHALETIGNLENILDLGDLLQTLDDEYGSDVTGADYGQRDQCGGGSASLAT